MLKGKLQKELLIVLTLIVIVPVVLFLGSMLLPKQYIQTDYPHYSTVAEIVNASDVIVTGEVVSARNVKKLVVGKADGQTGEKVPYTLSEIRITDVLKGDVKIGDVITIKQMGDYIRKPERTLDEIDGYLKKYKQELLFLKAYSESPYSLVNPAQGMVEIQDGGSLFSASRYSLFGYSEPGHDETAGDNISVVTKTIKEAVGSAEQRASTAPSD